MSKIAYLIAKEDWDKLVELKATEPLMEMLDNLEKDDERWFDDDTYTDVIHALGQIKDVKAVDFLIKYLKTGLHRWPAGGDEIRASSAQALGNIGDDRAIQPLLDAISDEVDEVREAVTEAVGSFGEKAVGPLVKLLDKGVITSMPKDDFDETGDWQWSDIRLNTIEALAYTNSKLAVDPLIRILEDKGTFTVYNDKGKKLKVCDNDWEGRALAAKSLGQIGDKRAMEPLKAALQSSDNDIRLEAACSLGIMGDSNGIKILITEYKAAEDNKKIKRKLKKIPPKKVGAELEKLELYDDAEDWYTSAGMLDDAAEMRKKKADMGAAKVSQKIIHGDYVDDRDTIIKDSVLNRSSVGGGGPSKMQELKELKEMFDSGFISEEEMEKMKKEILK